MGARPEDVGIIALELYTPAQCVSQEDLEKFDQVSTGKYTIGLGQEMMGFCSDIEDINSICLTVVSRLMKNYQIEYADIGRLEVGTETIIDKSKSVKTVLMQLFEESGNFSVEGIDSKNACYGGTQAVFNCVDWVESSAWDGRYAIAVSADIAVYAAGNARPTGGAGAVAILIGANAPLVIENSLRASFMSHVYDFYKPDLTSEYPVVDGILSINCFHDALDNCYKTYIEKFNKRSDSSKFSKFTTFFDALVFHTPFCKITQKAFTRLIYRDIVRSKQTEGELNSIPPHILEGVNDEEAEKNLNAFNKIKNYEKSVMEFASAHYERMTLPSLFLAKNIGNMYTASLYGGLISYLISKPYESLINQHIALFSYGSGLSSSLYSIFMKDKPALKTLVQSISKIPSEMKSRRVVAPTEYTEILKSKENFASELPFTPSASPDSLNKGVYYLTLVDEKRRRFYKVT